MLNFIETVKYCYSAAVFTTALFIHFFSKGIVVVILVAGRLSLSNQMLNT